MPLDKCIRWFCLAAIFLCALLYLMIDVQINGVNRKRNLGCGFFVRTSGCHLRALNPFSNNALHYLKPIEAHQCPELQLMRAETVKGQNYLTLMMSEETINDAYKVDNISEIHCAYSMVKRYNDDTNIYTASGVFQLKRESREQLRVQQGPSIIRVQCFASKRRSVYHDVHFFLPPPPLRHQSLDGPNPLSVMIVGIDSVSHMHFLRTMPLLHAFIKRFPHVEFWGYNRVGRNSYPNLVPMLSGLHESELEAACYTGYNNYDACPFIWNDFKHAGFKTTYAEDNEVLGTFNYGKYGFRRVPTDFYMRPLMVEINKHTRYSIDEKKNIHCSGGRKFEDIHYEFMYKMMPHLSDGPNFSMFWQTQGVHDYFNYAQLLDKDYLKLFQSLSFSGILNNTMVFLMSDHGLRRSSFPRTIEGRLEESQPLLIAIYPDWMKKLYPQAIASLQTNSHRLVTTFDLHATLMDLTIQTQLDDRRVVQRTKVLESLGQALPRGISLFLPIPEQRNCDMAGIPSTFCQCHSFKQIEPEDTRAERAANFVVQSINLLIARYEQCQQLHLGDVLEAYILDGNHRHHDIKVSLRTEPGKGLFEGTATCSRNSFSINGPILRLNSYGNESDCVDDYQIEMFCYCKPQMRSL
ncbi:hypothetical protein KR222_006637 [Zaprionus bogoriensis]|nr:hypothetical protein KR222_006637 [Zaprionus bogoriensis]